MEHKKILVIDDDKDINTFLDKTLSSEGYFVRTSLTAQEFFNEFKKLLPDLCIVDLNLDLSKGAGYEILRAIRNKFGGEVKIIIVSKRFAEEDIQKGLDLGADDYITKPLDKTTVQSKVNAVLGEMYKGTSSTPYFAVATSLRDSFIELNLKVVSINEEGVLLQSFSFISKGNKIKMQGRLFRKLSNDDYVYGTIDSSTKEENSMNYLVSVKFDSEDSTLMTNVRKLLLGTNKLNEIS